MMFLLIAGIIASIGLNVGLLGYIYLNSGDEEEKDETLKIPTDKQLTADDIYQLLVVLRHEVAEKRAGYVSRKDSEDILDLMILETKLKYAHAETAQRFGGKHAHFRLEDLESLPGYTDEELEAIYDERRFGSGERY